MIERNLISDQGAANIRQIYAGWLGQKASGISAYEAHLNLGLLAWRTGDLEPMRTHLCMAARIMLEVLAGRDLSKTGTVRRACDVDLAFMLVFLFDDGPMKPTLARLPRSSWFQPENEEYQPLTDLIDVLRGYAVGQKLDPQVLTSIVNRNRHPRANSFYQPRVQAMGEGLLSIIEGDGDGLQQALQDLLDDHAEKALEGEWRYLVEGLLSTWASVLFRLAYDAGIVVEMDSPYLLKNQIRCGIA